jgi:hypothetical protein
MIGATMMRRLPAACLAVLLGALCTAPAAEAQEPHGMLVLEVPASTRAFALGGAFPLASSDADALFHAPAFSSTLRGFALGGGWWSSRAMSLSLSGGAEWWGGALSAGLQTLEYEAGDVAHGNPTAAEALLGAGGAQRISERVATLGYAHRIWKLEVSVAAKLLDLRAGDASVQGPAFDVAVGRAVGPVRLVVAGQHLGPALEEDGRDLALPARASLTGATRSFPIGPLDIGAAATVAVREDGTVLPGGGIEVGYWPVVGRTFLLRAGVRGAEGGATPCTLGFGFAGDEIALDYAYAPYEDSPTSRVHRLSVRLR